jgi:hypothetical protein
MGWNLGVTIDAHNCRMTVTVICSLTCALTVAVSRPNSC